MRKDEEAELIVAVLSIYIRSLLNQKCDHVHLSKLESYLRFALGIVSILDASESLRVKPICLLQHQHY